MENESNWWEKVMKGTNYSPCHPFKGDFVMAAARGDLHVGLCGMLGFPLRARSGSRLRSFYPPLYHLLH